MQQYLFNQIAMLINDYYSNKNCLLLLWMLLAWLCEMLTTKLATKKAMLFHSVFAYFKYLILLPTCSTDVYTSVIMLLFLIALEWGGGGVGVGMGQVQRR